MDGPALAKEGKRLQEQIAGEQARIKTLDTQIEKRGHKNQGWDDKVQEKYILSQNVQEHIDNVNEYRLESLSRTDMKASHKKTLGKVLIKLENLVTTDEKRYADLDAQVKAVRADIAAYENREHYVYDQDGKKDEAATQRALDSSKAQEPKLHKAYVSVKGQLDKATDYLRDVYRHQMKKMTKPELAELDQEINAQYTIERKTQTELIGDIQSLTKEMQLQAQNPNGPELFTAQPITEDYILRTKKALKEVNHRVERKHSYLVDVHSAEAQLGQLSPQTHKNTNVPQTHGKGGKSS